MIYYKTEEEFRKQYRTYVDERYKESKASTKYSYYINSFDVIASDYGIDFWEMLGDDNLAEIAKESIEDAWRTWTLFFGEYAFTTTYYNYTSAIDRVMDFVRDELEPEFLKQILEESKPVSKLVAETIAQQFKENLSKNEIIDNLSNIVGGSRNDHFEN